jgi:hypothetical protein
MKSIKLLCAAASLALIAGAPAFAQDAMGKDSMNKGGTASSGSGMKMSAKDKKMMTKCQGMDHGMMMKNASCMKMMKMHPDMMQGH